MDHFSCTPERWNLENRNTDILIISFFFLKEAHMYALLPLSLLKVILNHI